MMNWYFPPVLLLLIATGIRAADYEQTLNELLKLHPEEGKTALITGISIQREHIIFDLQNGRLQLLSPVNGKTIAALFNGEGEFHFSPPTEIERAQLKRFYDTDSLNGTFNTLLIIFNDSTLNELMAKISFGTGGEIDGWEKIIDDALDYVSDRDNRYFKSTILKFLLDESEIPYFYAHFFKNRSEPFMFEINPFEYESVRFMHRAELSHVYKYPEIICQYPSSDEQPGQSNDVIRITSFGIFSDIEDNLDLRGKTRMHITLLKSSQRWIYFNIYQKMEIDSAFLNDSVKVEIYKPKDMSVFWIDCGRIYNQEDTLDLTVFYHCDDLLDRDTRGWIYLKSPLYWYPRYALWEPATYSLKFSYPSGLTLISIGTMVDSSETGDTVRTTWRPDGETTHAIFDLGYFERYPVSREGLPLVVIFKTEKGLLFRSHDIQTEIADDILGSIEFYRKSFGDIPFKHLNVSEFPFSLGMAFPELLDLSWNTFYETGIRGYDQVFRAHEVAHQWWGIGVGFDTYHDQWLSEAFAEFSGLEYLRSVSGDDDRYTDMIREMFERVISNRKYILGNGQEAGPIWLGTRTASTRTTGDYTLIIYRKGALVLRMLRIMMTDPVSGNEQPFWEMMKDYYDKYSGKRAKTEDFIALVSRHMDRDMQWFFDQWVYGTDIPSYEYGYRTVANEDGTYVLTLRVRQRNVPESFRMPVPFRVTFEQDSLPAYNGTIIVAGPVSEQTFMLPGEPDDLLFNYRSAVISDWDESDFDDLR
jgi:hypothetical protein